MIQNKKHMNGSFRRERKDKTPREATFQRKLMKKLRAIPCSYWFVKEAKSIRGLPDIIGCVRGRFVALEVKRSRAEASHNTGRTVLQKKVLHDMTLAKGLAFIIYPENEQEILDYLHLI